MLWTAPALRHRSAIDWLRQSQRDSKEVRPGNDDGVPKFWRNWRGHDDVMQTRSIRGSGEPVWVSASSNACFRLGPDPRRALWPAASPSHKQAGHMTAPDQCCKNVRKFLPRRRRPHMTQSGHRTRADRPEEMAGRDQAGRCLRHAAWRNTRRCLLDKTQSAAALFAVTKST
jgi:hypothetical protein